MKESKKIDNLNENIDKETEKRFNEELNEIKEKLNAEKLSDEFKANLQRKMEEELNKTEEPTKGKVYKFPTYTRKLAGICACFIFLFLGCFTYADDIENVILELFGTTDKVIAKAIEEGNYKEIDMDYVEDNGVSIKVDYVAIEDDNLYIAFNVLSEEDFDEVLFEDISIKNINQRKIYIRNDIENIVDVRTIFKKVSKNNIIIIYVIEDATLEKMENFNIEITKIYIIDEKNKIEKNGIWKINI